jgi:tRNA nucleotidyltransferase (CCA-adding enzyme)
MGPPTKLKENSADFLKRWKNDPRVTKEPYEKGGRFFVEIKRDYTDIKQFLKDQIKNMSMGKHLDKIVNKKYSVLVKEDLLKDDIPEFWTEYLDGKMSWER